MDGSRIDQLVDHCRHAMAQPGAAVAVAVDGHSAAGKSTVAAHLAAVFSGALVPGDDFYSVMDEHTRAGLSPRQSVDLYYDWRRMRDEAILPLLTGTPAIYRPYDWDNNQLSARQVRIEPASLVVVEGLFVARPELVQLLGIAVVVEADSKTRATRQAHRADATNDWLRRWDRAERYYLSEVRPPASFDFRIAGVESVPTE